MNEIENALISCDEELTEVIRECLDMQTRIHNLMAAVTRLDAKLAKLDHYAQHSRDVGALQD